jgi:transposase-like protein
MTNPNTLSFSREDVVRIKQLIKDGVIVHTELQHLREGLSDTVKAIAEEIDVKPAQLNRAIRIAYKDSLNEEREKLDEIEYILDLYNQASRP